MKTSRYTEPQILAILRQADGGVPVAELCREHGMMPLPGNGLSSNHERERVVVQMACEVLRHECVEDRADEDRRGLRRVRKQSGDCFPDESNRRLKKMFAESSMHNELLKEALGKK